MEAAGSREIALLPEELVSEAIALTTPLDAARAAAVSQGFRAAADSDAVWSRFLPRDLPPLAPGDLLSPAPRFDKARFLRLSDRPALLADGLMSVWLDRETGAKCYMLSARALHIAWGGTPWYWRWIPLPDSCSFSEGAELLYVHWLEIRGNINSRMLSRNSTYAAYIVFKMASGSHGLGHPLQKASVSTGERKSTHQVCLQGYGNEGEVPLPHERADGWMELKMGQFYNEEGDDGEVSISLTEIEAFTVKRGLIVLGIEIRVLK